MTSTGRSWPSQSAATRARIRAIVVAGADAQLLEVDVQPVLGVVALDPVVEVEVQQVALQAHRLVAEDARVHLGHVGHQRPERHLRQHVALEIDAGRDLAQLDPLGRQLEHAALGDVEHRLARRRRARPGEGDLLDAGPASSSPGPRVRIVSRPSATATSRPPAVSVPANTTARAVWLMLMKPPAPGELRPEARDVDVARPRRPRPCRGRPCRDRRRRRSRTAGSAR